MANLTIRGVDYHCHINRIDKSEVINLTYYKMLICVGNIRRNFHNNTKRKKCYTAWWYSIGKAYFSPAFCSIVIDDVDISKIIVSNKVSFGNTVFKHVIGYKDDTKINLSCRMLPKMSAYRRSFDETNHMSFLMKNSELLEKYNKTLGKSQQ